MEMRYEAFWLLYVSITPDFLAKQQGLPLMHQDSQVQSQSLKEREQSGVPSICCIVYSITYPCTRWSTDMLQFLEVLHSTGPAELVKLVGSRSDHKLGCRTMFLLNCPALFPVICMLSARSLDCVQSSRASPATAVNRYIALAVWGSEGSAVS